MTITKQSNKPLVERRCFFKSGMCLFASGSFLVIDSLQSWTSFCSLPRVIWHIHSYLNDKLFSLQWCVCKNCYDSTPGTSFIGQSKFHQHIWYTKNYTKDFQPEERYPRLFFCCRISVCSHWILFNDLRGSPLLLRAVRSSYTFGKASWQLDFLIMALLFCLLVGRYGGVDAKFAFLLSIMLSCHSLELCSRTGPS